MAPLGDKLPETRVTCSSRGSVKDRPENLIAGNTFCYVHMILILTITISESKSEIIKIVLVCDSCQFMYPLFPLKYIDETK